MLAEHLKRGFATLMGLWFLLVVIEPEAVHSCPVHTAASASQSAHGHHVHGTDNEGAQKKSSHAVCSCPGDCAASEFGALPSRPPNVEPLIISSVKAPLPAADSLAVERADLLLPFAIGPPASSIG
jgi:hypothetical protein